MDELPQLLQVLNGEMSLVGPRAYMPSELPAMGSYAATILRVKPGITGWWQISGRNSTTFERRLQMDEYYISNWSLWMDIYILLKTVGVVLSGQGT
jgi:lipopolysaccharide/colanic/teichoic acid biosynthesis glycosyltransferase